MKKSTEKTNKLAEVKKDNKQSDEIAEIEDIYQTVEDLENINRDDERYEKIMLRIPENRKEFFDIENLKKLSQWTPAERIVTLTQCAKSLLSTPKLAEKYFELYPNDIRSVAIKIRNQGPGVLDQTDFQILGLFPEQIDKLLSHNLGRYNFEQYYGIAERKNEAPRLVMSELGDKYLQDVLKDKVPVDIINDCSEVFDEAERLMQYGDRYIEPDKLFSSYNEQIDTLTAEQRALFLKTLISQIHNNLLFHEVYNSCFTAKNTKRMGTDYGGFNVAHSMIYSTYQPPRAYQQNADYYEWEMNSTANTGGDLEEYPYHRLLIQTLYAIRDEAPELTGKEQDISDTVVEFWHKNRNPIFTQGVADALSNLDANYSAHSILKILKKETGNKNHLSSILHRLEFGRIGISEEGVKYLEKTYDLGEYNNPNFHVSRLTADGEIGVFNEDKELIKYFQLGDLSSPEKKVRAKVLDFVYETLFIGQENETDEEKAERLQYLEEFKKHYYKIAEDEMFKGTGVKLNNLSFQEQGWFVMYFNQEQDPKKKEELVEVVKNFGENGLRVFFSMEFGGQEMGEHILALARNLPKEAAQAIFDKYSDLVNTANQAVGYVTEKFSKEKIDEATAQKIRVNLLRRAKNVLAEQSELLDINDEKGKIELTKKIIKKLNGVRADIILFAETYHASGLPIEEMPNTEFNNYTPEELSVQDKEQIINNAEMNVSNKKFGETVVIPSLKESFKNPNNKFHLIKHNGSVISSLRLEDRGKEYYFGSFYADPNAQGAGLGQEMMERVVAEAAKEKPVVASAIADQAPIRNYINKQGFVATKIMPAYENTGVDLFEIKLDKKSLVKVVSDTAPENVTFDLKNNRANFVAECEKRLNTGEYVMTGYEIDKSGKAQCEFKKAVLSDEVALQKTRRQIEEAA